VTLCHPASFRTERHQHRPIVIDPVILIVAAKLRVERRLPWVAGEDHLAEPARPPGNLLARE
jgi:hypothetical protein